MLDLDADDSSGETGADFSTVFGINGLPVGIADADATLTDSDDANLESLTIKITNVLNTNEVLDADTSGTAITENYNGTTGVLSLTGTDTVANYQQVLRTVTYGNDATYPNTTDRSITFVANDGDDDSPVATTTVTFKPIVTVTASEPDAAEAGLAPGKFEVTRTGIQTAPLTINFTVAGAATEGMDYDLKDGTMVLSGSVEIDALSPSKEFQVVPKQDTTEEPDEDVILIVTPDPAFLLAAPTAVVYIADDDGKVDIDADIDRDNNVEDDQDEPGELSQGIVVIRDHDNVYADPDEPAKLREIDLQNAVDGEKVVVKRSSSRVKLLDADGADLFGGADEITLDTGTYFLKGGAEASPGVRQDWLKVKRDATGAVFTDQLNITVLWVEISFRTSANDELSPDPINAARDAVKANSTGTYKLGVQRSTLPTLKERAAHGVIEIQGEIQPNTLSFSTQMPSGWQDPDDTNDRSKPAEVDFGFILRRSENNKTYLDGQGTVFRAQTDNDDSKEEFTDVNPDREGNKLLIVDNDAPGFYVMPVGANFGHYRGDFRQWAVFNYLSNTPERASTKEPWSITLDVGFGYDNKLAFLDNNLIDDTPNDGKDQNEVRKSRLTDLSIGISKAVVTAAQNSAGDREVKRNADTIVTVTGSDLVGKFILKKGAVEIVATNVHVKESDSTTHTSDTKEAKVTFNPGAQAASEGWELIVRNAAGDSTTLVSDFKIIP